MRVGIFDFMDCAHLVKALDGCEVPHGHTYKVEVVVEGALKDGMVMDFKALRETAKRAMAKYDHKDLSTIFEVPSCENVCLGLFRDIQRELPGLQSVRLWEGHNKWAEASVQDASVAGEPLLAMGSTR
jgi:6-pyruvoyltetrahydropterin/6-carboxytetrahydropterin synthase